MRGRGKEEGKTEKGAKVRHRGGGKKEGKAEGETQGGGKRRGEDGWCVGNNYFPFFTTY